MGVPVMSLAALDRPGKEMTRPVKGSVDEG